MFTNWKKKYLALCQQRALESALATLELDELKAKFQVDLTTLGDTTSYLNDKIDSLNKDLHNLEGINTHLHNELARESTKLSDLQSLYDVDTFNLQVRIAKLEDDLAQAENKLAAVPAPVAPTTYEPSVAEQVKESVQAMGISLFAKLKQELSNETSGRQVSTRVQSSLQAQPARNLTVPITSDNPLGTVEGSPYLAPPAQASIYIPSQDFLAATDEGLTYDGNVMLATGVGASIPSGPIKLPSEIIAEQQRFNQP
jgi:flagellar motor switch/type III secretory pathway protein FliN